jgi:hypothetical protein
MVWGGATLDVIARMRKDRQQIGGGRCSIRPHMLGTGPPREKFDCLYLCDECGYLSDTNPRCPSCGANSWIDLDYWVHAEFLREREHQERRNPSKEVRWQLRLASLAAGSTLGAGCAAVLAAAGVALGWPLLLGLGAGGTAMTHGLGRRRLGWSLMARRVRDPTRWRLPLPRVDPAAQIAERITGHLEPRDALLRAPFTGRACLGYEIAVMFDTPEDAWPPIWVLREMRSCAFDVRGRAVAADHAWLELPTAAISQPALDDEAKAKLLRQRGLFSSDGQFDLFESILEPGRAYDLVWPSLPAGAPPMVLPASRDVARNSPFR